MYSQNALNVLKCVMMHVKTPLTFVAITPTYACTHVRISSCSSAIDCLETLGQRLLYPTHPELPFHASLEKLSVEILLPPFLSDETAYLGAPPCLSFRPIEIK